MKRHLLSLYGLKWDPFSADVPSEALYRSSQSDLFFSRLEQMLDGGGFALITGDSGTGKSVTLRLLADHLSAMRDVTVGVLSRPQSGITDFYRELGHLFGVPLSPHNRWAHFKALRERWLAHFESSLLRPILLIDEAQQTSAAVLSELRLLSAQNFDSRSLLTTVLCGDGRLLDLFRQPDLIPLGSRIRLRLELTHKSPRELADFLSQAIDKAGAPALLTPEMTNTLAEHAAGNYRVLTNMAGQLLAEAARRQEPRIDEKLFLELFALPHRAASRTRSQAATARPNA